MLCSVFWISCPLKLVLLDCPETFLWCCVICKKQANLTYWATQAVVWNRMVQFRVIQFSTVWFGALYTNLR